MKLSKMTKEELEVYSYTELASMILKEEKRSLSTPELFKKICALLNLSDDEYANKIGDFYTTLTTDKTFILLDDASWDLRDHHSVKVSLEDETEDEEETDNEDFEEDTFEEDIINVEDELSKGDEE